MTEPTPDKRNSDEKLMAVVNALAGHELRGRSLSEIAEATGLPISTTGSKLSALAGSGWAEKVGERWRLGPGLISIANAFYKGLREEALSIHQTVTHLTGGDNDHDET